jgi:DNA-binding NarL/FixJ family response regulator
VKSQTAKLVPIRPNDSQIGPVVVYIHCEHPLAATTIRQAIISAGMPESDIRFFGGLQTQINEGQCHILILDTLSVVQWRSILRQWHLLGGRIVVLVPQQTDKLDQVRSVALGASAVVEMAPNLRKALPQAIKATAGGKMWISRNTFADYINETNSALNYFREPRKRLTRREEEIIRLMVSGESNKEIGNTLGVTERTVKFHVSNALQKLQAKSRRDVIKRFQSGSLSYLDVCLFGG